MYARAGICGQQGLFLKKWWSIWKMPMRDKKRGTWIGRIQKAGFPEKRKRGFKTKTEAVKWEVEETQRMLNPKPIRTTFFQCSSSYLSWTKQRRELNTYNYKLNIVKQFLKHLGNDFALDDITGKVIEDFLDSVFERSGGKTANRYLRELKTVFNWATQRNMTQTNPCRPIETYKEDPFIKYVPPIEDLNKVLSLAEEWEHDFLLCLFHTAGRRIELIRLRWTDINLEKRLITLWTRKRKGGGIESDELHINDGLKKILEKRLKNRSQESGLSVCIFQTIRRKVEQKHS
jgi:integrase